MGDDEKRVTICARSVRGRGSLETEHGEKSYFRPTVGENFPRQRLDGGFVVVEFSDAVPIGEGMRP